MVNAVGMEKMNPPIKDLLPRLTPILKNRHEKVQENCIDLVGRIADRGAEYVSIKEWMRICFELLEMLKVSSDGPVLDSITVARFAALLVATARC